MFALFAQALIALVIGHATPFTCGPVMYGNDGFYNQAENWILIDDSVCPMIELDPAAGKRNLARVAFAALVMTHEAEHASGIEDEHDANCEALRDLPAVLKAVGLGKGLQRRVAADAKDIQHRQSPPYGGKC